MTEQKTYSLALCGMLLLTFSAQVLLLAPHSQVILITPLTGWMSPLVGASFFLQGVLLIASVLHNYTRISRSHIYLLSSIMLVLIGWAYIRTFYIIEGSVIFSLALAFFLSTRVPTKRDWLVEIMQWVNLGLGIGLLLRPELLLSSPEYSALELVRITFAALFILSAIASIAIAIFPALYRGKAGRFLALPWFLWILMFILPFRLPILTITISVGMSLALNEFIPWGKIILRQEVKIGRRFFHLIAASQIVLLALMTGVLHLLETSLTIPGESSDWLHGIVLLAYNILSIIGSLTVTWINLSINGAFAGLSSEKFPAEPEDEHKGFMKRFAYSLFEPFEVSHGYISGVVESRREYESLLARQLAAEKRRVSQLSLLHELNLNLEMLLDPPVSAQLTANAINNFLGGYLAAVLSYDTDREELIVLAASGPNSGSIPPGYRQTTSRGLIGRAARLRRTQLASDTHLDPDYFQLENQEARSEVVVPLLHNNRLRGVIVVDHPDTNFFDESDIRTLETVAIQLVTSWARSDHEQRLTNLISAGVALSTTLNVDGLIQEVAETARNTLDALFVFVALVDKGGGFTRTAHTGYAPTLLGILNTDPGGNTLIQTVLNSSSAFRLRDVRKRFNNTPTGSNELRSFLAVPFRLRQSSIGAILAFGKQGNTSFSENDEALISLLATQSAAAIETTWLYQELRSMLTTATQLYQLSTRVIQSEQLSDAAGAIAETAYQMSKGDAAGIILLSPEKEIEARMQIDKSGLYPGAHHPMELINQALESGQTIILSGTKHSSRVCLPLQTPRRQYGALWVEIQEDYWDNARFTDNLHTLANQAAIALERGILLVETRQQAEEIEAAYRELEITYDQTLGALSSALDARDRETEGHSLRVARIACQLGLQIGLTIEQAKTLERGAILHDIGKIGISDTILLKPGPLTPPEWEMMRLHPDIGARIIEGIPFLKDALPVIRYHQERWDGSGYPIGLKGNDIPLMARIFAIVDAFDALTTERPYRKPIPVLEAVGYLREQAGILFDPALVDKFEQMIKDGILESLI